MNLRQPPEDLNQLSHELSKLKKRMPNLTMVLFPQMPQSAAVCTLNFPVGKRKQRRQQSIFLGQNTLVDSSVRKRTIFLEFTYPSHTNLISLDIVFVATLCWTFLRRSSALF